MDDDGTEDHECYYGLNRFRQDLTVGVQLSRSFGVLEYLSGQRRDEYATYIKAVRM